MIIGSNELRNDVYADCSYFLEFICKMSAGSTLVLVVITLN